MEKDEDKISLETLQAMRPGSFRTFFYDSVQTFQNALRLAYWVRLHKTRNDGYTYLISNNAAKAAISIKVVAP